MNSHILKISVSAAKDEARRATINKAVQDAFASHDAGALAAALAVSREYQTHKYRHVIASVNKLPRFEELMRK